MRSQIRSGGCVHEKWSQRKCSLKLGPKDLYPGNWSSHPLCCSHTSCSLNAEFASSSLPAPYPRTHAVSHTLPGVEMEKCILVSPCPLTQNTLAEVGMENSPPVSPQTLSQAPKLPKMGWMQDGDFTPRSLLSPSSETPSAPHKLAEAGMEKSPPGLSLPTFSQDHLWQEGRLA